MQEHKNTNVNNREEILNTIESHLDKDVERILNGEKIPMGDVEIPEFDEDGIFKRLMAEISHRKEHSKLLYWKIACAIAIVLLSSLSIYLYIKPLSFSEPQYCNILTKKGEKLVILMADGTRVWLNSDSKFTYPEVFGTENREVQLIGEAYFEVKKDAEHPFIVNASEVAVTVKGTRFNVRAYSTDEDIVTTLNEGKVEIGNSNGEGAKFMLTPGETAIYNKESANYKIVRDGYYADRSDWRENKIAFQNTNLKEVLEDLSRRFDVKFIISNPKINRFTYNLTCESQNLDTVLEMISAITPVKFEKTTQNTYIVKLNKEI